MIRLLLPCLAVGFAILLFLFVTQRRRIYFPRRYTPDGGPLPAGWQELRFDSGGVPQIAYWAPGPAADKGDPIIFVFSGNRSLALDRVGIYAPIQAGRPSLSFLFVEYPGYGRNGGSPTRASIAAAALEARRALGRHLGIDDAALRARTHVIGHSMGAATALEFVARVGARELILFAPFTRLVDMARAAVGWPLCLLLLDRFDNGARLREIAAQPDRPVVRLRHGTADRTVPVDMSRALAGEFPGWIDYAERGGVGHNEIVEEVSSLLGAGRGAAVGE